MLGQLPAGPDWALASGLIPKQVKRLLKQPLHFSQHPNTFNST